MVCTFRISTCILLSFIGFLGAEEARKPSGCGIRYDMGTRIVGGTSSHPGRWPWMAAMYRGSIHYCGGVLITDRHILTAAHCVARYNLHTITIRLGDFDLSKDEPIPHHIGHEITVGIRRAVIHKDYNAKLHKEDIAVLRITQSMNFSPFIQRICLPPTSAKTAFEGKTAVVAGWGTVAFRGPSSPHLREVEVPIWHFYCQFGTERGRSTNNIYVRNKDIQFKGWGTVAFRGPSSPHLREVEVPIWPQDDCAKAMGESKIFSTNFCAGGRDRIADSCQGDSGGPLMLQMQDHRFAVVGIVSWGVKCGDITKPGVYTRVAQYTDWILSAVRLTYKDDDKHPL